MNSDERVDGETLRRELSAFGLSEKEIETYLAVLDHGETTASAIADHADVSKRYVYSIASQLADRGFVRVNDHASPTTIRARSPEAAMDDITERLRSLTPALEERFTETEPQTSQFQMIKSRQTALKHLRTLIDSAREEVFVSVPFAEYEHVEDELAAAVSGDVLVLGLYSDVDPTSLSPSSFDGGASVVRAWEEQAPFMVVVDNQHAIVGDSGLLSGTHDEEDAVALSERHLAGSVLGSFMGSYWPVATETYVTGPRSLPRRFELFRRVVFQSALYRRDGVELAVNIEVEDGTELSGRVVDVRQSFLKPVSSDFPVESGLLVETEEGDRVSVGGTGAFVEDYRAETTVLRRAE